MTFSNAAILKLRVSFFAGALPSLKNPCVWIPFEAFILSLLFGLVVGGGYLYIVRGLPKISSLQDYNPPIISTVYSHDNRKIGEFCREKRIIVPTEKIPKMLVDAFIAAEDARFYKHEGIDFFSILRALFKNIEAGTIVQGGSTITQQVTKSLLLSPERSYLRKVREAILAYRIEKSLTKEEILYEEMSKENLGETSKVVRKRVARAREIQVLRFKNEGILTNREMSVRHIKKYCALDETAEKMMKNAVSSMGFSTRTYHRLLKISRTIADLDNSENIKPQHLAEALQYRPREEV